jgi:sugar phosphate isomerase/epimerase
MVCPGWDLQEIARQASALGYPAVELLDADPDRPTPAIEHLRRDPAAAGEALREAGVDPVAFTLRHALHTSDRHDRDRQVRRIRDAIDLAARLECPRVCLQPSDSPPARDHDIALRNIGEVLPGLTSLAATRGITLLIENGGVIPSSRDLWWLLDAAEHPALRCCWNPCPAAMVGERPSLSVPRLGRRMLATRLADIHDDPAGRPARLDVPGQGEFDFVGYLDLLGGITFTGDLIVAWPGGEPGMPDPADGLQTARTTITAARETLASRPDLSAFKGDKTAPRIAAPSTKP